jgi:23S rRNA (uracil1939-C5)-methyltransferase
LVRVAFFQVNPWQASNIYRRIQQIAGTEAGQSVAWDLYCGVGMISMLLSQSGFRTLGIEENPQAIRDAQRNVVRNDLPNQPSFIAGRVEDLVDDLPGWAKSPKLIVVNPSRRGIAAPVRQALCSLLKQHPDCKLVYLSCEVTSLARDLQDLTKSGRTIRQVEGYDMFPYTDKMEWLTVLT